MSNNKRIIWFLSWCTGITLVVSYVFSIVEFKYLYISNDFILVLFGGLFSSFCVMLLSEIKKYTDAKRTTEDLLYQQLLRLYTELSYEIENATMFLNNKSEIVPSALFDMRAPAISQLNMSLRCLDYNPFRKNSLYNNLVQFKKNEISRLDCHVANYNYFRQALNLTQIETLKMGNPPYNPNAADKLVEKALTKIRSEAEVQRKSIEGVINAVVSEFPCRYNWDSDKNIIDSHHLELKQSEQRNKEFFEVQ